MLKIIRRAGLTPWERVFHNLRASRQTELAQTFPAHVACDWLGNSEEVANEHYLHTTDADFQRAIETTQIPTRALTEMAEMAGTVRPAGNPETQKPRSFRGIRSGSATCTLSQLPDQGTNLCEFSREKQRIGIEDDALSDALWSDRRLVALVEAWAGLPDDAKDRIAAELMAFAVVTAGKVSRIGE